MKSNLPEPKQINPLKDKSNPRAMINLVPSSVSKRLEMIPDDIFMMSEKELRKAGDIGEYEERLRISLWREYDNCQVTGKNMVLSNVYEPVCSQTHFLHRVITNSFRLAYILTPPAEYALQIEEMLNLATDQVREILVASNYDQKGNINTKLADVKMKIWHTLLDRAKGGVVHRSESLNLNLVQNQDANKQSDDSITDIKELDAKLNELNEKFLGRGVIDVTEEKD